MNIGHKELSVFSGTLSYSERENNGGGGKPEGLFSRKTRRQYELRLEIRLTRWQTYIVNTHKSMMM